MNSRSREVLPLNAGMNAGVACFRRQNTFEIVNEATGREQRLDAGVSELRGRRVLNATAVGVLAMISNPWANAIAFEPSVRLRNLSSSPR